MRRGTDSHKIEYIGERVDLFQNVRVAAQRKKTYWTYQSRASSCLAHFAEIFSLSRTLVAASMGYLSSSEMGKMLANHHGKRAASIGMGPYANITRGCSQGAPDLRWLLMNSLDERSNC